MAKVDINNTNESKEARGQRLKILRQLTAHSGQKQLSRATIERKYGLSSSTLRHWEEAFGSGLTEEGALQVVDIYQQEGIQCSVSWLLNGTGGGPSRQQEFSTYQTDLVNPLETIIEEYNYFKKLDSEAIVFEVKDDAMAPFYLPGDIVGGIRHYRPSIPELIGRDCIIENKKGEVLLRRLHKSTIPDHYNLFALNPDTKLERPHIYDVAVIVCSPVVRIWRGKKWTF